MQQTRFGIEQEHMALAVKGFEITGFALRQGEGFDHLIAAAVDHRDGVFATVGIVDKALGSSHAMGRFAHLNRGKRCRQSRG